MKKNIILFVLLFSTATLAQETPAQEPAAQHGGQWDGWTVGMGLSLGLNSKLNFNKVTRTGISGEGEAEVDINNAIALDFDLRYMPANSWGVSGGMALESEREVNSVSSTGAVIGNDIGNNDKFRMLIFYGNGAYRWDQFYIPVGLNVSYVSYYADSGSIWDYDAMGGIGAQFGVGYYLTENVALEFLSRAVGMRLKVTSGATETEYERGWVTNSVLSAKFIF